MENTNFLAKKIVDKKLSVRQAESLIRVLKFQVKNLNQNQGTRILSIWKKMF